MSTSVLANNLTLEGAQAEIAVLRRRVRELEEELAEHGRRDEMMDPHWRRLAVMIMLRWSIPSSPAAVAAGLALAPHGTVVSCNQLADQIALARRAGLSASGVRDWETARHNIPLFVKRLRDALRKRNVRDGGVLNVRGAGYVMTQEARDLALGLGA